MNELNINLILCDKVSYNNKLSISGIFDKLYSNTGDEADFYIYLLCSQFFSENDIKERNLSVRIRHNADENGNKKDSFLEINKIKLPTQSNPKRSRQFKVNVEWKNEGTNVDNSNFSIHARIPMQGFGMYQVEVVEIKEDVKITRAVYPFELCRNV